MARILDIRDPIWDSSKRIWVLKYAVADEVDGKNVRYIQTITCEALISVERYIQLLKEKQK